MSRDRFIDFTVSISKLNKSVQQLKADGMKILGLKAIHSVCLYVLFNHKEGMKLNDIVRACDYDKALVSRTLKELIELGYITKTGEDGKYNTKYFLSEDRIGDVVYMKNVIGVLEECVSDSVSAEELTVFYQVLNKFVSNINEIKIDEVLQEVK